MSCYLRRIISRSMEGPYAGQNIWNWGYILNHQIAFLIVCYAPCLSHCSIVCFYSAFTVLLQCFYSTFTVLLQCFYSAFTVYSIHWRKFCGMSLENRNRTMCLSTLVHLVFLRLFANFFHVEIVLNYLVCFCRENLWQIALKIATHCRWDKLFFYSRTM